MELQKRAFEVSLEQQADLAVAEERHLAVVGYAYVEAYSDVAGMAVQAN